MINFCNDDSDLGSRRIRLAGHGPNPASDDPQVHLLQVREREVEPTQVLKNVRHVTGRGEKTQLTSTVHTKTNIKDIILVCEFKI